jgi:hypothetical protein
MNSVAFPLLLLIIVVVVVLFVLAAIGFAALIIVLGRRQAATRAREVEAWIEDWADEEGYELLAVREADDDHPFADRFGFGAGRRPGVVRAIKVRDRKNEVRRGWVYIAARRVGGRYRGFDRDSLEVAWEDED